MAALALENATEHPVQKQPPGEYISIATGEVQSGTDPKKPLDARLELAARLLDKVGFISHESNKRGDLRR